MSQQTTFQTDNTLEIIEVPTALYLQIESAKHIQEHLTIHLSNHSYYPRIDDLQSDWVSHVATPAFKLLKAKRGSSSIDSFCSIGTGSGLDVLSAIEILGVQRVGLTDVHEDVVGTAVKNITRNYRSPQQLRIESGYGDLLSPLRPYQTTYDVIYENLPNVPLQDEAEVTTARKSSTHLAQRKEEIPSLIKQQLLDLHFLALAQTKDFLTVGGSVLSTLGARVPLHVFLSLGSLAGLSSSFLLYTWKVQDDPATLLRDYAEKQKEGFGPFFFYRTEVLQQIFSNVDTAQAGTHAEEIERALHPYRINAARAYEHFQHGESIGHTVAILESQLRQ
jgi:hypothetical protein